MEYDSAIWNVSCFKIIMLTLLFKFLKSSFLPLCFRLLLLYIAESSMCRQPYDIHVAHQPITTLRHILINIKDKDHAESKVLTVRLLILGRLAETWKEHWLNTNKRPRMVISGITFLNTIEQLNTKLTGTALLNVSLTAQTTNNGWTRTSEPMSTASYLHLTNGSYMTSNKTDIPHTSWTNSNKHVHSRWMLFIKRE